MKVLIMHTLPPDRCDDGRWEWEFDLAGTADELRDVLPEAMLAGVRGEPDEMMHVIRRERPDVVVNLCEAPLCNPRFEAHAAALFEWLRVPFTGSRSETLALCRRKDLTKRVLSTAGLRVPRDHVWPCIVKPLDEDGSAGIYPESICHSAADAQRAIARLPGPVVVEEFLPGREFVVSMWGPAEPEHVVVGEIAYRDGVRILTYEGKWDMESHGYVNAPLVFGDGIEPPLQAQLVETGQAAWRATGLRGYGTVDVRLDAAGWPVVLDVNPNAAINEEGRIHRAVMFHGWTWEAFMRRQLEWAC
jgi:D-alanine-D-alanine ligase